MDEQQRAAIRATRDKAVLDRQRLDVVIAYLSEQLGESPPPGGGGGLAFDTPGMVGAVAPGADPVAGTNEGEYFDFASTKAALALLQKFGNREHPLKTKQIFDALRKGGVKISAEEGLYRSLARSHTFRKVGKGLWGLSEWYPPKASRSKGGAAENNGDGVVDLAELQDGDHDDAEQHGSEVA